jgi:5-methylcytosine-specific restriction enzyme subunit McrC
MSRTFGVERRVTTTADTSIPDVADQIKIRNVWYLLLYAWEMAAWRDRWKTASERAPSLLGLLSQMLVETTRELLRNQLGRAYRENRETITGLRGRIDFSTSLKLMTFEQAKAHCAFGEMSVDTLKNRIVRSTLHRLASDLRLAYPKHEQEEARLRHELRSVVRAMDGVALTQITLADFGKLQLTRNDRGYLLPLNICALVQRLEMPTEGSGDRMLRALVKDEITFHDLFERFVRNFYRLHASSKYQVMRETLRWPDQLRSSLVPVMKTDVSLVGKMPPYRRLVIDTKYSVTTLSDTMKFKSANLYQVYAYLRTQEHRSEAHRHSEGLLLYPTTSHHVDEAMFLQGHLIRVATVNLADHWESIDERLRKLIEPIAVPVSRDV